MKNLALIALGFLLSVQTKTPAAAPTQDQAKPLDLGAFSVSLAVHDLAASKRFYERLGFSQQGEFAGEDWLILRNGTTVIGLFEGQFENNLMTFNPGWNPKAEELESFTDVRELEARLRGAGIEPVTAIPEQVRESKGPASFVIADPDGNQIVFDQHR